MLVLAIPMSVAQVLLMLVPGLVLLWVLMAPGEALRGELHGARRVDLRPFAIAALAIQLVLYALL